MQHFVSVALKLIRVACCPVIIGRWRFCQQDSVIGRKPQCDFEEYANSKCHKEAVEISFTLPKVLKDVGESLSEQHSEQKKTIEIVS